MNSLKYCVNDLGNIDSFFDDFDSYLTNTFSERTKNFKTNVYEDKNNIYFESELPGVKKEDINVSVENYVLKISVSLKESENKTNEYDYHIREFQKTNLERAFKLPKNLELEKINAINENGILKLIIPKIEEKENKLNIEIK